VGLREDLAAGWRVLRGLPDVRLVLATFTAALLLASGYLSVGLADLVGTSEPGAHGGAYGALLGVAGCFEVLGALVLARVRLRNLAITAVLGWVLLGAFRLPLGFTSSLPLAAALLAITGLASAVTDVPLVALVQRRVPPRHLAKALGLWEAGIALAVSVSPPLAALVIAHAGLRASFAISSSLLIALGTWAAVALRRHGAVPSAPSFTTANNALQGVMS
jgi:predicted MFS family arabinose efflux permease